MKNLISEILSAIPVIVFLLSIAVFAISVVSFVFYKNADALPILLVSGILLAIGIAGLVFSARFRTLMADNSLSVLFNSWW